MKTLRCENPSQLDSVAKAIIEYGKDFNIWVFVGEMGAGKTTLIKSLAKLNNIGDIVSSPSFSIVNEYVAAGGKKFYHFDFYRIDDPSEVVEIGIEEYFYSGNTCWIEWAEKIPEHIPDDFYLIKIQVAEDDARVIRLQKVLNGEIDG